ncbi:aldolase/citrate lyase family protein [Microbacterium sp. ET2]|uniref:HpcH/HpaI aldolase family protein n=1 Tax=Microbacterium albipurpureum TaxID=3050384 RepID=UPI00259CBF82|nr:aldolase/citrate lyase family protein [Microbacterium sp. ET2 (Ac-2212)]WJL96960.1 aldolase/citrate lyase family protein [Microbacterium sp. ET2 (Ac-2212)]
MSYVNPLRAAAAAGQPIRGAWLASPSAVAAEAVASAGYDYVSVDMQHGTADLSDAVAMFTAIGGQGTVPMARVPSNDAAVIGRILDIGALGIVVPLVETAEEAAAAVAATLYPPHGVRSFGPVRASTTIGSRDTPDLEQIFVAVMVETPRGLDNVDAIAATPGLDAVYVGPADLALGLGLPPAYERTEPEHVEAIERIRLACERHGIVAGVHCAGGAMAARRLAQGFGLTTIMNDLAVLKAGAEHELRLACGTAD